MHAFTINDRKMLIVHNLVGIAIEIENVLKQHVMLYALFLFTANEVKKSPLTIIDYLARTHFCLKLSSYMHYDCTT